MNATTTLVFPIVHLNGTGRATLVANYTAAYEKLGELRETLARIEFNARDYYVHPERDAFTRARAQRNETLAQLEQIGGYLEAHLRHLGQ